MTCDSDRCDARTLRRGAKEAGVAGLKAGRERVYTLDDVRDAIAAERSAPIAGEASGAAANIEPSASREPSAKPRDAASAARKLRRLQTMRATRPGLRRHDG